MCDWQKNNHTSTMAAVPDRGTVSLKNEINVEKINYDFWGNKCFEVQKVTRGLNEYNVSICGFSNEPSKVPVSRIDIHQL